MLHLKRVQLPCDCHAARPSQNKFPLVFFHKAWGILRVAHVHFQINLKKTFEGRGHPPPSRITLFSSHKIKTRVRSLIKIGAAAFLEHQYTYIDIFTYNAWSTQRYRLPCLDIVNWVFTDFIGRMCNIAQAPG